MKFVYTFGHLKIGVLNVQRCKIFCYMLFCWKRFYPKKWKTIIGDELNEKIDVNKIIQRIGFTSGEKNEIFKFISYNKKAELIELD